MEKFLKISQLRKDIKGGKEVCMRKHTYIKMPREGAHSNHPIKSVSSLFHHIQPRIVDCSSYCLDIGGTTHSDMKYHLKTYVLENFPTANQEDASLFPLNITISRQMYKAMMKLCHLKIDEVNVLKMIDVWKEDAPADFIYFCSQTSSSDIEYANTEDNDDILYHVACGNEDIKNNLLFIHMTVVQKLLLQCYINLVLMDATYYTCRLMFPLFFLTMKTNVNYSPVTSFIVQNEDTKSISKALSRIKQYISVDGIDIKNFMIDCLPKEMQSIREIFPDCGLYLCDFHRNQCWGRWFRTTWHGISQHYELLMSTFKKVGESSSVSEYKRDEEYLKRHTVYKESSKLWEYFQRGERNKKVCITLINHWACSIRTDPFKITLAVVMYCGCTSTLHIMLLIYDLVYIPKYTTILILVC